jgi:hypothetical protein
MADPQCLGDLDYALPFGEAEYDFRTLDPEAWLQWSTGDLLELLLFFGRQWPQGNTRWHGSPLAGDYNQGGGMRDERLEKAGTHRAMKAQEHSPVVGHAGARHHRSTLQG